MLIIDSLLMSKSFRSREVRGTLAGRSSASSDGLASQVHCAQLASVVRLIAAEHGKRSMQQFSHYGHDHLQPSFAASK